MVAITQASLEDIINQINTICQMLKICTNTQIKHTIILKLETMTALNQVLALVAIKIHTMIIYLKVEARNRNQRIPTIQTVVSHLNNKLEKKAVKKFVNLSHYCLIIFLF